ncbi:unnamed protein product [Caenorhabditis angaria]|uniref:Uncharacterized protein n=1 Tax=Caenorhabditis angaria TaxID=860376 RepID=A0A9P1J2K0_9PELO|nr:unnamed protein product [Caenorhabditis angaria]
MCSSLTQVVFTIVMLGAIALTVASIFGEKWSTVAQNVQDSLIQEGIKGTEKWLKYLPFLCEGDDCASFWKECFIAFEKKSQI